MNITLKSVLTRTLAAGTLAAALGFATPATAGAQGFGVGVQFGAPYPAAFAPRYDDRFRYDAWRRHQDWARHEDWVRHEEWLHHREWERMHRFYGRYGVYGR